MVLSLLIAAGIILPAWMIGFELWTHQISGSLFDPMPTVWHALLLVCVPITNTVILFSKSPTAMLVSRMALAIGLPMLFLDVLAIGREHLFAVMKCFFGAGATLTDGAGALFGDYYISPLAALAVLTPFLTMVASLVIALRDTRQLRSVTVGWAAGLVILFVIEVPRYCLYRSLEKALITGNAVGLDSDAGREVVARLSHLPQQFSSAGGLYAVGPVDLFGPLTSLIVDWEHPCGAMQKLAWNRESLAKLSEQLEADIGSKLAPVSWRGLSPWERWTIANPPNGR